jgi:riboflavin kinase / FMN adenylyltransferase
MKIIDGLENLVRSERPVVMTIGNFDGVHLGHQAIIRRVVELARNHDFLPMVMTFQCHPLKFLNPKVAPALLMPIERRLAILEEMGIDEVVVLRCVGSLLHMDRDAFIRDVLLKYFQIHSIIEGRNFRFGCDRTGDIDHLIHVGPKLGFHAVRIESIQVDLDEQGLKTISSSLVRKLVSGGHVDLAQRCLGRPFQLLGKVVAGAHRGRTIGFPTANLEPGEILLPEDGVYAVRARIDEKYFPAAGVVGPAPTFDQFQRLIEAYVLDYQGDLYGKTIALDFYRRIRPIVKFDSSEKLVEQINRDVQAVRDCLSREENN